ncbi:AraC family transcriptional regulator [Pseudoalteromonas tunicata]|nr:AraC family transcriptional regulator [Pseudoalteromonas tunicata]AXT32706.1 AraC family transcriptional regulator [Pseudoalteromonas tunicata]MDP4982926.1 AraC family transcriptional regulator [Pseudoalteromonas tunicata]MDP5212248.1 AraC family transcriptional regulator [Pseudoalteromonas tunicata]
MAQLIRSKNIQTLIDNRTVFNSDDVQICLYDTYQTAHHVPFKTEQLMLCAMSSGEKVMHHTSFDQGQRFVPGQSFMIAAGEEVAIDFPTASWQAPTSCLTIEIDSKKIQQVVERLALEQPPSLSAQATLQLDNTQATQALYQRLTQVCYEEPDDRGLLLDLGISELIVRLFRVKARAMFLQHVQRDPELTPLHAALAYMQRNLHQQIEIEEVCKVACVGRSRLYGLFKKHLNSTPQAFLLEQRLSFAADKIKHGANITRACYDSGFVDPSHFSRRFKSMFGLSPKQFQQAQT